MILSLFYTLPLHRFDVAVDVPVDVTGVLVVGDVVAVVEGSGVEV